MDISTVSQLELSELRKTIAEVLSLPKEIVISGYLPQGFSQNETGFVTVEKLFSNEIGRSRKKYDGKNQIETITTSCLTTVQVSAYGNNAVQLIEKLRSALQLSEVLGRFKSLNIGLVSFSDVKNLTTALGAGYEERASIDLVISHTITILTQLTNIELIDIDVNSETTHIKPQE